MEMGRNTAGLKMADGVFVGLATIDLIYTVESLPPPNSKAVAQSQELFVGGPATNAAITFSQLGSTAALVTAAGRHKLASIIQDELARYSIELVDLILTITDCPPSPRCGSIARGGAASFQ